jgi:hypothetical protein
MKSKKQREMGQEGIKNEAKKPIETKLNIQQTRRGRKHKGRKEGKKHRKETKNSRNKHVTCLIHWKRVLTEYCVQFRPVKRV